MNKYKVLLLANVLLMTVVLQATPVEKPSVITAIKEGKEAECVGVKKVTKTKRVGTGKYVNDVEIKETIKKIRTQEGYKVDISLNEAGDSFEATEQDSDDLGGYSPIPYPCKFIESFTSTDFNITNENVFYCKDDTYDPTEEVYLVGNCRVSGS